MPEAVVLTGWRRGRHATVSRRAAYRVPPSADRATLARSVATRPKTAVLESRYVEARPEHRGIAAPWKADTEHAERMLLEGIQLRRHRDAGLVTRAIHRLQFADDQKPLVPPPVWELEPLPIDWEPRYLGTALFAPPAVLNYRDHPAARYNGRQMDSAVRTRWPEARPATGASNPRWWGRLLGGDLRRRPVYPPPGGYVATLPLAMSFHPAGIPKSPPARLRFVMPDPVAQFTGRHLDSAAHHPYREAARVDRGLRHGWSRLEVIYGGPGPGVAGPGTDTGWEQVVPGRIVVPRKRAYLMLHDVELVRVSDGVQIPFSALHISADVDSWADTVQATCHGPDAWDLLADGVGVELEARVDGYTKRLIVESPRESLAFGRRSVSLTARSLSALLHTPHQDPGAYSQPEARTVAQLAEQALPVGEGWSIVWDLPDWVVPAGAWEYVGRTPAEVLGRIAADLRCTIRPDRATRRLTFSPRYPILPWAYGTIAEDLVIPAGTWLALDHRQPTPERANAVYVQGGQVGGVQARVYRSGSAGDRPIFVGTDLITTTTTLLTHADAARHLGAQLLAGYAESSPVASITLPMNGTTFPLVQPGWCIRLDSFGTVFDTAMSVELSVELNNRDARVRQTISLGESGGSAYARLRATLAPRSPLLLATATTDHADGTTTVSYPSGGTERVRGSASPGQSVWVRNGVVEGEAPNMSLYDLAV